MNPVTEENIIFGTFLLIILLAVMYFVSTFYLNRSKYDLTQDNSVHGKTSLKRVLESCPVGMCAIDVISGTKRCPGSEVVSLTYDPSSEVCTYPDSCPIEIPFALNPDGSTNESGACSAGLICRCSKEEYCANNVTAKFVVKNGIPNVDMGQFKNYVIEQEVSLNPSGAFNRITKDDPAKDFCKINPAFTDRVVGGCNLNFSEADPVNCFARGNCIGAALTGANYASMVTCQANNPCQSGVLAYNVDDKEAYEFNQYNGSNIDEYMNDSQFYTVGCTVGKPCDISLLTTETNKLADIEATNRFFPDFDELAGNSTGNSTGVSLYQPVWDPTIYQTICVRPYPLLLATTAITGGALTSVTVDFSGQDFGHYTSKGSPRVLENDFLVSLGPSDYIYNDTPLKLEVVSLDSQTTQAVVSVNSIDDGGRITKIDIVSPGSGYTLPPRIKITSFSKPS